jgi:hypothetical protein
VNKPTPAIAGALLLVALLAQSAAAQIYRVETKDGVIFTDKPPVDGSAETIEEVELPELNTATPTTVQQPPAQSARPAAASAAATVAITSPANESTIAMGPGDFQVTARAEPALQRTEQLQLLIDGEAWGDPQSGSSWAVTGALRGPHDLVVQRRLREKVVAESAAVRVYVLRPSLLNR